MDWGTGGIGGGGGTVPSARVSVPLHACVSAPLPTASTQGTKREGHERRLYLLKQSHFFIFPGVCAGARCADARAHTDARIE